MWYKMTRLGTETASDFTAHTCNQKALRDRYHSSIIAVSILSIIMLVSQGHIGTLCNIGACYFKSPS